MQIKSMSLVIFVIFQLTPSFYAHSQMSRAEIAMIEIALKTLGILLTERGSSSNLSEVISSIDCNKVDCSPYSLCRYFNIGSSIPNIVYDPCKDLSREQPPRQSEEALEQFRKEIAIQKVIVNLPKPKACIDYEKTVPLPSPGVGQLIIKPPTNIPKPEGNIELYSACKEEREKQRKSVINNRDEVLKMLGFNTSLSNSRREFEWLPAALNLILEK